MTDDTKARVLQLCDEGLTVRAIAAEVGMSVGWVHKHVRKPTPAIDPGTRTPETFVQEWCLAVASAEDLCHLTHTQRTIGLELARYADDAGMVHLESLGVFVGRLVYAPRSKDFVYRALRALRNAGWLELHTERTGPKDPLERVYKLTMGDGQERPRRDGSAADRWLDRDVSA